MVQMAAFSVTPEMRESVELLAEEKGVSVSALLRMAIAEYVDRQGTAIDRGIHAIGDEIKQGLLETLKQPGGPERVIEAIKVLGKMAKT